ncbi:hypothetical protein CWS01_04245 [Niallia nealsonii]|uniref:Uncharacterized protein n=1 Tax=Niallia nealsonii TaxID=115979 RepID=A0A2N0Z5X6_9BACI|nr:hypothetical protein CWS01_04245 [Niallia nealsonii]
MDNLASINFLQLKRKWTFANRSNPLILGGFLTICGCQIKLVVAYAPPYPLRYKGKLLLNIIHKEAAGKFNLLIEDMRGFILEELFVCLTS